MRREGTASRESDGERKVRVRNVWASNGNLRLKIIAIIHTHAVMRIQTYKHGFTHARAIIQNVQKRTDRNKDKRDNTSIVR